MDKNNNKSLAAALICACVLSPAASAIETFSKDAPSLELKAGVVYTDNLNPTLASELSATGGMAALQGQLVSFGEGVVSKLQYQAQTQQFFIEDNLIMDDDRVAYDDYQVKASTRLFLTPILQLDGVLSHSHVTEHFGEGISQFRQGLMQPDEYDENHLALSLNVGADIATRRASISVFHTRRRYEENNQYATQFDLNRTGAELDISFMRSDLSRGVLRLSATEEAFELEQKDDSVVYNVLLGFDWQASGKSGIQALLGGYQREFDSLPSTSGVSWLVNLRSQLTSHWLLSFISSGTSEASTSELAKSNEVQDHKLKLLNQYSDYWQIGATIGRKNTEFLLPESSRTLEQDYVLAFTELSMSEHNHLRLSITLQQNESSDNSFDYDQNKVNLSWSVSF